PCSVRVWPAVRAPVIARGATRRQGGETDCDESPAPASSAARAYGSFAAFVWPHARAEMYGNEPLEATHERAAAAVMRPEAGRAARRKGFLQLVEFGALRNRGATSKQRYAALGMLGVRSFHPRPQFVAALSDTPCSNSTATSNTGPKRYALTEQVVRPLHEIAP